MNKIEESRENQRRNKTWTTILRNLSSLRVWRILTCLWILWVIWWWIAYKISPKYKAKIEDVISHEKSLKFDDKKVSFWDDNKVFFEKDYEFTKEKFEVTSWWRKIDISIIIDAWLNFYRVSESDFTVKKVNTWKFKTVIKKDVKWRILRNKKRKTIKENIPIYKNVKEADFDIIIEKLSQIDRFSYLSRKEYDRGNPYNKTSSFNVPAKNVVVWMPLPIPLDSKIRTISIPKFAYYCNIAINEMKSDDIYWKKVKELVDSIWDEELIATMVAFARSESAEEYTNFTQPIWKVELHRWEQSYKSFSFTYFHILMRYEWLRARKNLWLTEGQCYHPVNASKLFLAYWIEKSKSTKKDMNSFFPLNNPEKLKRAWKFYNGSFTYVPKLSANYRHVKKLMNWDSWSKKI